MTGVWGGRWRWRGRWPVLPRIDDGVEHQIPSCQPRGEELLMFNAGIEAIKPIQHMNEVRSVHEIHSPRKHQTQGLMASLL